MTTETAAPTVAENAPVENVEQPEAETSPEVEKTEVVANGDQKAENGEVVAEDIANGEAPNAESTPVKTKKKGRTVISNMRAAFQRLDLMGQLRTLGRRMRGSKQKQQKQQDEQANAETTPQEKPQENGIPEATPAAETNCNGVVEKTEEENKSEEAPQPAFEEEDEKTSEPVVEPTNNESVEPTAVVAQ